MAHEQTNIGASGEITAIRFAVTVSKVICCGVETISDSIDPDAALRKLMNKGWLYLVSRDKL